jgi:hypothetical protein
MSTQHVYDAFARDLRQGWAHGATYLLSGPSEITDVVARKMMETMAPDFVIVTGRHVDRVTEQQLADLVAFVEHLAASATEGFAMILTTDDPLRVPVELRRRCQHYDTGPA